MNNHMSKGSGFSSQSSGSAEEFQLRDCNGQCVNAARQVLDEAFAAASPLGKEKSDLSKRFQYLLDVSGQDRHKQAEVFLEHSLALYEAMYGQEHPAVAQLLSDLGRLYTMHGDTEAAQYVSNWATEILNKPKAEPTHEFFHLFGMNTPDGPDVAKQ